MLNPLYVQKGKKNKLAAEIMLNSYTKVPQIKMLNM